MTGYMFRNAEYRKSLYTALSGATSANDPAPAKLPPVTGEITVSIAEGMEAKVDASAYMAELRSEVEGLRAELLAAKDRGKEDATSLITYIQKLGPQDQGELMQTVSPEVLEAMSQLVATLLIEMEVERDAAIEASTANLRELLIVQLVTGYKLRELQVKSDLKDKFWGREILCRYVDLRSTP